MYQEEMLHIFNGILLSHKKEWNNAICSNMDGLRDYHTTEVSQTKMNRTVYYWSVELKKIIQMNSFIKQKQTYSCQGGNRGEE